MEGYVMKYHVKVRYSIKIIILLYSSCIVPPATGNAQQYGLTEAQTFVQKLMHIQQKKQTVEDQQRILAQQESDIQQKIARQQEQLLYKEQEVKEWRAQQQEELNRSDIIIKKLQQENDFAESERLKAQKNKLEQTFVTQKDQREAELKKQYAKITGYQQELNRLKQEREALQTTLANKDTEQKKLIDTLVTKSVPLQTGNDLATLRKAATELKIYIDTIKSSSLKDASAFINLLQNPLDGINQKITHLTKMAHEGFIKQANYIKKNIIASRRPEELNNIKVIIDKLKKDISTSMLSKSQQKTLYDYIETQLESLVTQKNNADSGAQAPPVAITASRPIREPSISPQDQEPADAQPETELQVTTEPEPTTQPVASEKKTENLTINGFVLNSKGNGFNATEYRNVAVVTDQKGDVVRIVHDNKNIGLILVPKSISTNNNSPEWIAAEIYAQQLGNDQKLITQTLEQAKAQYNEQAKYDHADVRYNKKLLDYLHVGLIPVLETKKTKK